MPDNSRTDDGVTAGANSTGPAKLPGCREIDAWPFAKAVALWALFLAVLAGACVVAWYLIWGFFELIYYLVVLMVVVLEVAFAVAVVVAIFYVLLLRSSRRVRRR